MALLYYGAQHAVQGLWGGWFFWLSRAMTFGNFYTKAATSENTYMNLWTDDMIFVLIITPWQLNKETPEQSPDMRTWGRQKFQSWGFLFPFSQVRKFYNFRIWNYVALCCRCIIVATFRGKTGLKIGQRIPKGEMHQTQLPWGESPRAAMGGRWDGFFWWKVGLYKKPQMCFCVEIREVQLVVFGVFFLNQSHLDDKTHDLVAKMDWQWIEVVHFGGPQGSRESWVSGGVKLYL